MCTLTYGSSIRKGDNLGIMISFWCNGKKSICQCRRCRFNPYIHRKIPGEGNGNLVQYSCLKNPMDRGPWQVIVHGVAKESDPTEQQNAQGAGRASVRPSPAKLKARRDGFHIHILDPGTSFIWKFTLAL